MEPGGVWEAEKAKSGEGFRENAGGGRALRRYREREAAHLTKTSRTDPLCAVDCGEARAPVQTTGSDTWGRCVGGEGGREGGDGRHGRDLPHLSSSGTPRRYAAPLALTDGPLSGTN
ncbi:hypothetical protein AAFF_G00212980 [Aldrovandia affinis]|uniref:Uncharacterized protein n=1 Tax=Aldrovandia affinis TaxID=143900 RepID=A0AAD7RGU2_9TELE|nr:hypothetical protein AAFF_G00212980 [Aldrovandia affinis]